MGVASTALHTVWSNHTSIKRIMIRLVFLIVGLIPTLSNGQDQSYYPPLESAWKLEQGISESNIDFDVKDKGVYIFVIMFRYDATSDTKVIDSFLGDGSYIYTVDESINSRRLVPNVDGSFAELQERAGKKEIVRQLARPGTVISLGLSVERIDVEGMVMEPRIVETKGIAGYRSNAKFREVAAETLEPGRYRVRSSAKSMPVFPKGLSMSLAVLPPRRY